MQHRLKLVPLAYPFAREGGMSFQNVFKLLIFERASLPCHLEDIGYTQDYPNGFQPLNLITILVHFD